MQHCTDLPRQVTFPAHTKQGKTGQGFGLTLPHQEKEKNEKKVKRKAEVKRRQANFKEAACCPSAVVQGAARRKNSLCKGSARGNWDPREG